MSFLKIENLSKNFNHIRAVDGIDFEVEEGEVFGLLGPNGAGKSTTISIISTLFSPSRGDVYYKGKSILKNSKPLRQSLGIVPQEIALYPTLSGYQNLCFWGNMYGIRGKELKKRVYEVADTIGIHDRLKDKVNSYSGGMKRRLNIGAALLHSPKLLIMDEPTVGIDPQSRNHILDSVLKLNKQGMTIIYTSHYMEEVEYLCSRICIMDQGRIIACGKRDELIDKIQGQMQVYLKTDRIDQNIIDKLKAVKGILRVEVVEGQLIISGESLDSILADIIAIINEVGSQIISIDVKKPNLEAVFLHLTGKKLRD